MRAWIPVIATVGLAGCWKTDLAELPTAEVDFSPAANPAVQGWLVREFETAALCPDGLPASVFAVYPSAPAGPVPVALVLHSGAFDYVLDPPSSDPLGGVHLRDPERLDHDWSVRKVYATLGMYDDNDPIEDHLGALAATFAVNGVAMVLPANCWGDWWHNQRDAADNDFAADQFYREGRLAAAFGWQVATDAAFAGANGVAIPATFDADRAYLVGLGEGGRGVAELLHGGLADPAAIVVDSTTDDLGPYYAAPDLYAETVAGLDRVFVGGEPEADATALAAVADLPPMAFLYSDLDAAVPAGANDGILGVLAARDAQGNDLVVNTGVTKHVFTASDAVLSQQVADWLAAR